MTARMSRSGIIVGVLLIVGLAVLFWLNRTTKNETKPSPTLTPTHAPTSVHGSPIQTTRPNYTLSATQATLTPTVRGEAVADPTPDPTVKAAVRSFIDIMGGMLEGMGAKRVAPVADRIVQAVKSGNWAEIHRTFHEAIYDRFAKMSESIPAIRQYLNHSNPYVRFSAGRALIIAGQSDGIQTMLDLVSAPDPIVIPSGIAGLEGNEQELRREAARVLAKFRVREAVSIVAEFSRQSSIGPLGFRDLVHSGFQPDEGRLQFNVGNVAISTYGLLQVQNFVPMLEELLNRGAQPSSVPSGTRTNETEVVATWALAQITKSDTYVEGLASLAKEAIAWNPGFESFEYRTLALKHLGSVEHPKALEVLESALESENTLAVKYAVVNLLFNHDGGSGAARKVLIEELRGGRKPLGVTLSRQIAAGLDDPEVHAIAAEADRGSSHRSWRYWGIERKDWPIYNWIDDYVVKLRRDYER